jgi:hypothetical protein
LKGRKVTEFEKIYRGDWKWWSPFWATNLSRHSAKQGNSQSKKNIATIFFFVCDRALKEGTPPRCEAQSLCNGPERHRVPSPSETYPDIYLHPVKDGVRISTVETFMAQNPKKASQR